jgi:uncharacterized protein (TIGR02466 family)
MIKTWFPVSIYLKENIVSDNENLIFLKEINKIKKKFKKGGENWNTPVYNTMSTCDLRTNKVLNKLCVIIEEHTNLFATQLKSEHNYKISESWFNYYNKGDYQEYHHHANSIFSAVYFFTNPEKSGHLIFENPIEPDMFPLKNVTQLNDLNYLSCRYNPTPKSLIIFRSNIRHMVNKCNNNTPRITAAFNLL